MSLKPTAHPHAPPGIPCYKPPARLPSATKNLSSPDHPGLSLVPLDISHVRSLYENLSNGPQNDKIWTWIPRGPYASFEEFEELIRSAIPTPENIAKNEYMTYAVLSKSPIHVSNQASSEGERDGNTEGTAIALIRYLNLQTSHLSVEIGMVLFPLTLQRTKESSLIFYLLIDHAVRDLGFERIEWKANVLNAPSVRCAERLGFQFEGVFRRHWVIKGVWRDTWWGSLLADEWTGEVDGESSQREDGVSGVSLGKGEHVKRKKGFARAMEEWLEDSNFDDSGHQRKKLEDFRE